MNVDLFSDSLDNISFSPNTGKVFVKYPPNNADVPNKHQNRSFEFANKTNSFTNDFNNSAQSLEGVCSRLSQKLTSIIPGEISVDDSQFLSNSFSSSDQLSKGKESKNSSIDDIFEYGISEENVKNEKLESSFRDNGDISNKTVLAKDISDSQKKSENSFCNEQNNYITDSQKYYLSSWGLPVSILKKYENKGLSKMFQWQVECLNNKKVLLNNANLVYSAPTSAGKTLIAEILAIKTVLERHKKVIFILPFVSVVREKAFYFQDILGTAGIRVEGFMGSYNPPGGFETVQIAICTIEKANGLINRILEEGCLNRLGAVVVDEMHLVGDSSRGYLLELLLTKLLYMSLLDKNINIQIIGMSATLPNLSLLAKWLRAELYMTNFRPIPLYEKCYVNGEIYNNELKLERRLLPLAGFETDTDNILQLCLETLEESCSVLIFCPTKNWCESLSQQISAAFWKLGSSKAEMGQILRQQLNSEKICELLEQLRCSPVGLDAILERTVSFGIAFHHAGLTMDERDIIEGAFRNGTLRVLIATSTLSSGVNLPARRVIIRTPTFHGKPIDTLTYRQMIGRAGRMGKDTCGESILICQKNDYKIAKELLSASLEPVESCLEGAGKLKRALLEVIASGVVSTPNEVNLFAKCTLLATAEDNDELINPVKDAIKFLQTNQFIRLQEQADGSFKYVATSLAKACLSSSVPPEEGLTLFTELEKARQCFVLETELHLIYLVTPYSASNQWGNMDWMLFLDMWEKLPASMKRVGDLVGVSESYIISASRGKNKTNTTKLYHKLQVHKRFFTALALQDLVNEIPLSTVASKFNCSRGMLQSLQQSASTFAGMVTAFSRKLGWSNVEILISQFQDRLQFGISRDLLDLMKLPILNGPRARALYNAGIETLAQLATSDVCKIENILHTIAPFESKKEREGETEYDAQKRNKVRVIWITGMEGMTERDFASMLIQDARKYLQLEMGLKDAKWEENDSKDISDLSSSVSTDSSMAENVSSKCNASKTIAETRINFISGTLKKLVNLDNSMPHLHSKNKICDLNNSVDHSTPIGSKLISEEVNQNPKNSLNKSLSTDESFELQLSLNSENPAERNIQNEDFAFSENSFDVSQVNSKRTLNLEKENVSKNITNNDNDKKGNSNNSGLEFENISLIEKAFASSFDINPFDDDNEKENKNKINKDSSIDDFIACSQDDFDSFTNCNISKKLQKRKCKKSKRMRFSGELFEENSSLKKKKTLKSPKSNTSNILPNNESGSIHSQYKKESNNKTVISNAQVNFTEINIINVCNNEALFKLFCEDLKQQQEIALSVACIKVEENKPTIGTNIIHTKQILSENNTKEKEFTYKNKQVVGISCSWGENNSYYISFCDNNVSNNEKISLLKNTLEKEQRKVRMFDCKEQIKILKLCCDIDFRATADDAKVMDWLLDPEGKEKGLQAMVLNYYPEALALSRLCGSCRGAGSIGLDIYCSLDAKLKSSIEAILSWHLVEALCKQLLQVNSNLLRTYCIEMKSLLCLAEMELNGIGVDTLELQHLADLIKEQTSILERQAFTLAGKRFSFTSSTDVAKVLGIYRGKKVSTNKQVLEQNQNPIAKMVIQWRKLNSTLTKMVYPLIRSIQNGRIHGICITHTATGRVSMHEPNLQNIPRNFEISDNKTNSVISVSCRLAFISSQDNILLSADYCQLELRLLAHFSQDKILCDIMKTDEDVFKSIAAKWNNIKESEVNDTLRQQAKQICYGIIYGMGTKALAEQLSVDEEDALEFVETFHKKYPCIKKFISDTISKCKEFGYVETLGNRRRYLLHINHENTAIRSQAERQAVNTTIQGSAADIAKRAIVLIISNFQKKFKTNMPKLVLQLHDEFLFEVPEQDLHSTAVILKESMEKAVKLSIPFPVRLKAGQSWGSMKDLFI